MRNFTWAMVVFTFTAGCTQLPNDVVQRIQKANGDYRSGRFHNALQSLNGVIASHPQTKGVGQAYYIRGLIYLRQQSAAQARRDFERALNTADDVALTARVHAQLGHMAYREDAFETALTHYQMALRNYPDGPPKDEVYYRLGDSLQKSGHWSSAREVFPKVWTTVPDSPLTPYAQKKFSWQHDYFSIQCGAFQSARRANELADELRQNRLPAAVRVDTSGERAHHVVLVGSFQLYREATMKLPSVQQHVPSAYIVP